MRVIFCRRHQIGSFLLRVALRSSWSHCGVVTKDGKHVIHAAAFRGVVKDPYDEFIAGHSKIALREIELPDDDAAYSFLDEQLGKGYDWFGVLGIGFNRKWEDDTNWYCNELVEGAAKAGGRQRFINDVWRIVPQHTWMVR